MSWNRVVGWTSLAAGIAVGLVMGLWSFDGPMPVPAWLGDYADTSRRLARLGHIAFIGLGILNLLLDRELSESALGERARRVALWTMNAGNVLLPVVLFLAAAWRPFKYVLPLPATCVFVAMVVAAYGAWRGYVARPMEPRDFSPASSVRRAVLQRKTDGAAGL